MIISVADECFAHIQEGERALLIKVVDITRCLLPVDSANSAEVIPVPRKDDLRVGSEAVSLAGSTVASQSASAMTSAVCYTNCFASDCRAFFARPFSWN